MSLFDLGLRLGKLKNIADYEKDVDLKKSVERISSALAEMDGNTPESVLKYFEKDIEDIEKDLEVSEKSSIIWSEEELLGCIPEETENNELDDTISTESNSVYIGEYSKGTPPTNNFSDTFKGFAVSEEDIEAKRRIRNLNMPQDESWLEDRCIHPGYKEVLKGEKSYKDFLKENPDILTKQRKMMFINACSDMRNPVCLDDYAEYWSTGEIPQKYQDKWRMKVIEVRKRSVSSYIKDWESTWENAVEYMEKSKEILTEMGKPIGRDEDYYREVILTWLHDIEDTDKSARYTSPTRELTYAPRKLLLIYIKTLGWNLSLNTPLSSLNVTKDKLSDFIISLYGNVKEGCDNLLVSWLDRIGKFLETPNIKLGHIVCGYGRFEKITQFRELKLIIGDILRECKGVLNRGEIAEVRYILFSILRELRFTGCYDLDKSFSRIENVVGVKIGNQIKSRFISACKDYINL